MSKQTLCCVGCSGLISLTPVGPFHTIKDASGRLWHFEEHHYCGPIILRKDGDPKTRQPGSRSPFWPAYYAWKKAAKAPELRKGVTEMTAPKAKSPH
jgi:hypothetical protein